MKTENQLSKIKPADRLASVSEYYFSKKLKEVAQMNAEGKDVISLGIGSPDMPPSESTIQTLCDAARNPDGHGYQPYVGIPELRRSFAGWYKRWYGVELDPNTEIQRSSAPRKVSCMLRWLSSTRTNRCWFPIPAIPPILH